MTPDQLVELERKLTEACIWAQESGWRIVSDTSFGNVEDNTCCPIGAACIRKGYAPSSFTDALGLASDDGLAVGYGFDACIDGSGPERPDLYAIGARLRARFLGAA